jgi:hypothetical protein
MYTSSYYLYFPDLVAVTSLPFPLRCHLFQSPFRFHVFRLEICHRSGVVIACPGCYPTPLTVAVRRAILGMDRNLAELSEST